MGSIEAKSASSLAIGSLQAQPAPGDSDVSRGAWSAVTSATVRDESGLPGGDGDGRGPGDRRVLTAVQDPGADAGLDVGDDQHVPGGVRPQDLLAGPGDGQVVEDRRDLAGSRRELGQLFAAAELVRVVDRQ